MSVIGKSERINYTSGLETCIVKKPKAESRLSSNGRQRVLCFLCLLDAYIRKCVFPHGIVCAPQLQSHVTMNAIAQAQLMSAYHYAISLEIINFNHGPKMVPFV
jgi:hypothetical protein